MSIVNVSDKPTIVARQLADAIESITTIVAGSTFTIADSFGVTYSGTPAHLVLAALSRTDLTPELGGHDRVACDAVRDAAGILATWFTSTAVPAEHAAAFTAMTPAQVCAVVAYLAAHGKPGTLREVGPASLPAYTAHLTSDALDDPNATLPTIVDRPRRWLDEAHPLDITPTTGDGSTTVALKVDVDASEDISWQFRTTIEVSVEDLHDLLAEPGALSTYVQDNRDLIDDHLTYEDSMLADQGLEVDITLVGPGSREPDTGSPESAPENLITVYYVGVDAEHARRSGRPYLIRDDADRARDAEPESRVFTAALPLPAALTAATP